MEILTVTANQAARRAYTTTRQFGFDPRKFARSCVATPKFLADLLRYRRLSREAEFPLQWRSLFPILTESTENAGTAGGPYFHQDLWAARKIFQRRPQRHVDIGSRIDGFIAHLLVFMAVDVIDIRPLDTTLPGLRFIQDDATKLANVDDNSVDSLSSLHAAEHFGLGRYGDPIAPDAYIAFIAALARVLKPNGRLYFSVPCGRQRVEFNAHRVFAPSTILHHFRDLRLLGVDAVGDDGQFYSNCSLAALAAAECGCGLFEFTKTLAPQASSDAEAWRA